MAETFWKDPNAKLDYKWDWSAWLGVDTIATFTVTAATGLTVDSSSATTTAVTAWLSGGSVEQAYSVVCHIVTVEGRQDDRTIQIMVTEQ